MAETREKISAPTLAPPERECILDGISGDLLVFRCRCFPQLDSEFVTFAAYGGKQESFLCSNAEILPIATIRLGAREQDTCRRIVCCRGEGQQPTWSCSLTDPLSPYRTNGKLSQIFPEGRMQLLPRKNTHSVSSPAPPSLAAPLLPLICFQKACEPVPRKPARPGCRRAALPACLRLLPRHSCPFPRRTVPIRHGHSRNPALAQRWFCLL